MAAETSSGAELHPREHIRGSKKKFKQIFGDDRIEEEHPVVHERPTRKTLYPQSPLRGYDAMRAARLVRLFFGWRATHLILF